MISLTVLLGAILATLILSTLGLYLGARLTKSTRATLARATLAALLLAALTGLLNAACLALPQASSVAGVALGLAELLIGVVLDCLVICWLFRLPPLRAFLAWLPKFGASLLVLALALLVVRPYLVDAFTIPTQGMAPTILAPYRLAACPSCGGALIVTVPLPDPSGRPNNDTEAVGVCAACLQNARLPLASIPVAVQTGDRFFVSKIIHPKRWSIVMHQTARGDIWLKRIVGLPGETVAIADGAISINGSPLTPPPELAKSKFPVAEALPGRPMAPRFATAELPLKLGADEYFVMGDNAAYSNDSRYHGPIKASALRGVVDAIYWPPSRWRTFP